MAGLVIVVDMQRGFLEEGYPPVLRSESPADYPQRAETARSGGSDTRRDLQPQAQEDRSRPIHQGMNGSCCPWVEPMFYKCVKRLVMRYSYPWRLTGKL